MQKLLVAAAALAFMGSAAMACDYHTQHVTASADQSKQTVTMSTHDGKLPPIVEEKK
jgi:hypothetical protein